MPKYIAVIGPADCAASEKDQAYQVGALVAARGGVIVCGGGGGVMEAAASGARSEDGVAIGILPGNEHDSASPSLSYTIATGLGEARNAVITRTADAVIAVGGEFGTLSEIALAMKMGKPVILLDSWQLKPARPGRPLPVSAKSAGAAVELAFASCGQT